MPNIDDKDNISDNDMEHENIDDEVAAADEVDLSSEDLHEDADPDEFFKKKAFRMVYQTNNFFLPQVGNLIDDKEVLNLRPEYQRRLRWNQKQKSKLIESFLLNIPVPPVFFFENEAARYEVMDGQQRLNAIREFIVGDYPLTGLDILEPLNGFRHNQLPPVTRRAFDRASLSAIVLLLESRQADSRGNLSPKAIRRFVFDRLNTGGKRLNPQEIRNALNPGSFNDLITELSRNDLFTKVFSIPAHTDTDPNDYYETPKRQKNNLFSTMGDCQLVLRYFALKVQDEIKGSMKLMLDRAMERSISEAQKEELKQEYLERFEFLYHLFDEHPYQSKDGNRASAPLYDALMVAIHDLWDQRDDILQDKLGVQERLKTAMNEETKAEILKGKANTAEFVRKRIDLMKGILIQKQSG